jgi:hypothetical protein
MFDYGMGPGWVSSRSVRVLTGPFQIQSVKPICSLLRPEWPSTHQGFIQKDFLDGMKPNPRTVSLGVSFWFFSPTIPSYSNKLYALLLKIPHFKYQVKILNHWSLHLCKNIIAYNHHLTWWPPNSIFT